MLNETVITTEENGIKAQERHSLCQYIMIMELRQNARICKTPPEQTCH